MDCLDETTVTLFLDRKLSAERATKVESHIDSCDSCRRVLSELARGRAPAGDGGTVGRYVLVRRIGAGGMGTVYAAYDPVLDRKVAVKLLHRDATRGSERLVREAQALARVSSPNVVAVFDVGTFEDQIYISMELVEGGTLRDWLRASRRSWRDIAHVFAAAGRGLAAAHARGIVHRDFKPENVLVSDGHVRVADFGLAAPVAERRGDEIDAKPEGEHITALDQPLTITGAVVGTPAYMAPEQLAGEATDEKSDQFSFCVALYEALYGMRPFAGDTLDELSHELRAGTVRTPRSGPLWLRAAVLRGLARDPAQRHPSMKVLVAALERRSRAAWIAAGVAAAVAVGAIGVAITRGDHAPAPCRDAASELGGAWNVARRAAGQAAFAHTGRAYAATAWLGVDHALDSYASDWVAMRTEACEATRVRGTQSDEVLGLRMACLDRRRDALDAIAGVIAEPNDDTATHAIAAVEAMPAIAACADVEALRHAATLPADPTLRRRVEDEAASLASLEALRDAGRYSSVAPIARGAVADARALSWRPIESRALLLLGDLEDKTGHTADAAATLRAAALAGEAGRDDTLAAEAWIALVYVTSELPDKPTDDVPRLAAAALERVGSPPELDALLASHEGVIAARRGAFDEARVKFEHAIDRATAAGKELELAGLLNNLGNALVSLGRHGEAAGKLGRALELRVHALGPDHPDVATTLVNLGNALDAMGNAEQAVKLYARAIAIDSAALGPDHPRTARILVNAAIAYSEVGRVPEAIALVRRAIPVFERVHGPESAQVGEALVELGGLLAAAHQLDEAIAVERRALAITEHVNGADHPAVAHALNDLGLVLNEKGDNAGALAAYQRALAIATKTMGPKHPRLAYSLSGIGDSYEALGDDRRALEALDRAYALLTASDEDPGVVGQVAFHLAKVTWKTGAHARARELATSAAGKLADRREVDAWLAAHPP